MSEGTPHESRLSKLEPFGAGQEIQELLVAAKIGIPVFDVARTEMRSFSLGKKRIIIEPEKKGATIAVTLSIHDSWDSSISDPATAQPDYKETFSANDLKGALMLLMPKLKELRRPDNEHVPPEEDE